MRSLKCQLSLLAFAVLGVTACSDSTGITESEATSAIHSLALGMRSDTFANLGIGFPVTIDESFDGIAPFLNKVTVNIGGSRQSMYALGLNRSFPPGTCSEAIFGRSPHTPPDACTFPTSLLTIVFWQSHSATELPDQIMLFTGDVGTSCFAECPIGSKESFAQFVWQHEEWFSGSGPFTSNAIATTSPCTVPPLPYYAKSANCSIATFDLEGKITFGNFVDTNTLTMTIPRQTIHGVWLAVTEVQTI